MKFVVLLLGIVLAFAVYRFGKSAKTANDAYWANFVVETSESRPFLLNSSIYIEMSDGVKLACDIYFPNVHEGKLKTFLHFTRYGRRMLINPPFSWIFGNTINARSKDYYMALRRQKSDFALVTVDVRGTGASEGTRNVDLSPREVLDYQEVLDFVLAQKWVDSSHVSTGGISYDGMTGLRCASHARGKIQNLALVMSPIDIYEDLCFTGGLRVEGFLKDYGSFTGSGERGVLAKAVQKLAQLPWVTRFFMMYVVSHTAPVEGFEEEMHRILKEHDANWDMTPIDVAFKDDAIAADLTAEVLGTSGKDIELLALHNVSTVIYGGFFDSGSVRSGERVFKTYLEKKGDPNRIAFVIGPWSHGVRTSTSPAVPDTDVTQFRLFDHIAKIFESGISEEDKGVHYFTINEEKWKTSSTWPPTNVETKSLYLREGALEKLPGSGSLLVTPVYDQPQTSMISRWNLVRSALRQPIRYPYVVEDDSHHTLFLDQNNAISVGSVITGSPVLKITLQPDNVDVSVFAYLEDVVAKDDGSEDIIYISEGMVRGSHQCLAKDRHPLIGLRTTDEERHCVRSFKQEDFVELKIDEESEIVVILEPVSFQVRGKLRLRLAGNDSNNFKALHVEKRASTWKINLQKTKILLPIEK